MVNKVDAPPVLRVPSELSRSDDMREYFIQLERILFDLWRRTGGYDDTISENDMAANAEDSRRFVELRNLTKRVVDLESAIEGLQARIAVNNKQEMHGEALNMNSAIKRLDDKITTLENLVN